MMRIEHRDGKTFAFWRDANDVDHSASVWGFWTVEQLSDHHATMSLAAPPIEIAARHRSALRVV